MKKSAIWLCCLSAAIFTFSACSKKEEKKTENKSSAAQNQPPPKPPEPPAELILKWQAGKTYIQHLETLQTNNVVNPVTQQPISVESTAAHDLSLTVRGEHELEVEYLAGKMESKIGPKVSAAFDSSSDPRTDRTNVFAAIQRRILKHPFKAITDANGKVEKIEGFDDFLKKVISGGNRDVQTALKRLITQDVLKSLPVFPHIIPNKSVQPGESWKIQSGLNGGALGELRIEETVTFKGWEQHDNRKCALLDVTGIVLSTNAPGATAGKTPAGAATTPAQPAAPVSAAEADRIRAGRAADLEYAKKFNASTPPSSSQPSTPAPANTPAPAATVEGQLGTLTGKAWFDPELGNIVESTSIQNFTLAIPGRGSATVAQTVDVKLTEVKDAAPAEAPKTADTEKK